MLDILAITSPIYLIIFIGYLMTRLGLFAKADMRLFGKFVIQLALPALLFRAVSSRPIQDIFNARYLLVYATGSLAVLALGYGWSRRRRGLGATTSTFYAMGMACSNSGFVGYPILALTATLAPLAGVVLALNMIVENLLVIPLLLVLAEHGQGGGNVWRTLAQSLQRLAVNPLVLALLAGLAVSLWGGPLPAPIERTVGLLASASGALSLFVIGGALVGLPMRGMVRRVLPITLGKLLGHPLLVLLAVSALPLLGLGTLDTHLRTAAVLMAAMPMMGIYPTLAQAYGQEDFAAAAMLLTTVTSFFTLSALLWALRHLPTLT